MLTHIHPKFHFLPNYPTPIHTQSSLRYHKDDTKNPTKKAPGKGGHHLALCYPSTHPSSRVQAKRLRPKLQKAGA